MSINASADFNIVERNISPELRELVQSDEIYSKELKTVNIWEPRPVHVLMTLLRKHVTSDVTADETFQTLMSLQGLHAIKQEDDESTRAFVDRIKDALVRFETVSPHGRVFKIPDVQVARGNLASAEDRQATRATSSRDTTQSTATILIKADDMREVEIPELGWVAERI